MLAKDRYNRLFDMVSRIIISINAIDREINMGNYYNEKNKKRLVKLLNEKMTIIDKAFYHNRLPKELEYELLDLNNDKTIIKYCL